MQFNNYEICVRCGNTNDKRQFMNMATILRERYGKICVACTPKHSQLKLV